MRARAACFGWARRTASGVSMARRGLDSRRATAWLAALFAIDGPHIWNGVVAFIPAAWQPTARELGRPVLNRMGAYVRGQLFSSLCVGTVIAIGLLILRVRYAVLIGGLAAALNIV